MDREGAGTGTCGGQVKTGRGMDGAPPAAGAAADNNASFVTHLQVVF